MKNIYKIILSALIILGLSSQFKAQLITNGDFEAWTPTVIWTIEPDGWITGNNGVLPRVIQDSLSNSGELAMKVIAIPTGLGSFGEAYQTIDISYIPEALIFHAKWTKSATAYINVSITFYNNEQTVYTKYWTPEIDQSEWTEIIMELDQIEPIMTHVIIRVSSSVGDFAPGEGWLSIDDMSLGEFNSIQELIIDNLIISPNPCDEVLRIGSLEELDYISKINIFDISGKLLYSEIYTNEINVSKLPEGSYILNIDNNKSIRTEKFIIKR